MVFCVRKFDGVVIGAASIKWVKAFGQTDEVNVLVRNWSKLFSSVIEKHALCQKMLVSNK